VVGGYTRASSYPPRRCSCPRYKSRTPYKWGGSHWRSIDEATAPFRDLSEPGATVEPDTPASISVMHGHIRTTPEAAASPGAGLLLSPDAPAKRDDSRISSRERSQSTSSSAPDTRSVKRRTCYAADFVSAMTLHPVVSGKLQCMEVSADERRLHPC